jgi:hypothetical protein
MSPDLSHLIQEARRELRRASQLPLNLAEQAEERRAIEIDEREMFLYTTFRPRLMFPLKAKVVWGDRGAAGQLTVDNAIFHLRTSMDFSLLRLRESVSWAKLRVATPFYQSRPSGYK